MQSFTILTAIAAPLPIDNIDTDMIIPKQFLKTIQRTGLKEGLFYEMRFDVHGKKNEKFVLHQKPFNIAQILVSGANFGCGSSREHAPWALLDFGIRAIIAPSFADIFYNNCFKNGILPITLQKDAVNNIMEYARSGGMMMIDLDAQTVMCDHPLAIKRRFDVEPFRKHCLLNGLDDIGLTLQKMDAIQLFEKKQKAHTPWQYTA